MALYWVSYNLDKPGQDYPDLIKRLRALGATRILLSDWLLPYNNTNPDEIRTDLDRFLDKNDRIMVCELHHNAAWRDLLASNGVVKALFANNA